MANINPKVENPFSLVLCKGRYDVRFSMHFFTHFFDCWGAKEHGHSFAAVVHEYRWENNNKGWQKVSQFLNLTLEGMDAMYDHWYICCIYKKGILSHAKVY